MKQVPDVVTVPGVVRYSKRDRQNLDYWVKEKRITKLTSNWITGAAIRMVERYVVITRYLP